ncbi:glycosyltransferase family 4 protein [Methanolobus sp. WCC5]|uniref:glycosyltransferase family 4 protein n=1 Tax=Methanolobus sp. WCC5 TaxID=3125785 RepID=UPI0032541740
MIKKNICIVTFAISKSGIIPLSNSVNILNSICENTFLISVNEGYTHFKTDQRINTVGIMHKKGLNIFTRISRYIYSQIKMSYLIAKVNGKADIFLFTIGGDTLLFPVITAKMFRKKVVIAFAGSSSQCLKFADDNSFKYLSILSKINISVANRIIVYSNSIIQELDLQKYEYKIDIAPEHFINFDKFTVEKSYNQRTNLVGYVGRFSEEKGIMNFVESIPLILEHVNVNFLLIGDGQLREKIEHYILANNLSNNVNITGWIDHDELPSYLNKLKLVVVPSYTEGLPNLMLEAMVCGTPVLVTPVGSIPDIVIDEETGFIMKCNSPECISNNVIRVLDNPNIDKIIQNAKVKIENDFSYNAAVERYRKALENI